MTSIVLIHEEDNLDLIKDISLGLKNLGYRIDLCSEVAESDSEFVLRLIDHVDVFLIVKTGWDPPISLDGSLMWRMLTLFWKIFTNAPLPTEYAVIPMSFGSGFGPLSNGLGNREIYSDSSNISKAVQRVSDEITAFIVQRGCGSERKTMSTQKHLVKVLTAIHQIDKSGFVNDTDISEKTGIRIQDVQDYMDILEERNWTQAANSNNGYCAALTAHGRTILRDPHYSNQSTTSTVINVSGNQGVIVNANSILKDVTQAIDSSSHFSQESKEDLSFLIIQLNEALATVSSEHAESTEAIAETAKALVEHSDKDEPNKTLIKISAEGLKQAAQNIAVVAPTVIGVVTKIIDAVSK